MRPDEVRSEATPKTPVTHPGTEQRDVLADAGIEYAYVTAYEPDRNRYIIAGKSKPHFWSDEREGIRVRRADVERLALRVQELEGASAGAGPREVPASADEGELERSFRLNAEHLRSLRTSRSTAGLGVPFDWAEEFARDRGDGDHANRAWTRLMDRMPHGTVREARFAVVWLDGPPVVSGSPAVPPSDVDVMLGIESAIRNAEGAASAGTSPETPTLRELLRDAADELEAVYRNQYGYYHKDGIHPAQQHKFDRDMELVSQLRGASEARERQEPTAPTRPAVGGTE